MKTSRKLIIVVIATFFIVIISILKYETDYSDIQHIKLFFELLLTNDKKTYHENMRSAMYLIDKNEGEKIKELYKEKEIYNLFNENEKLRTKLIIDSIIVKRSIFYSKYDIYLKPVVLNNKKAKSYLQYIAMVKLKDTRKINKINPYWKIIKSIKYRNTKEN